jgi:hypothetical protein
MRPISENINKIWNHMYKPRMKHNNMTPSMRDMSNANLTKKVVLTGLWKEILLHKSFS